MQSDFTPQLLPPIAFGRGMSKQPPGVPIATGRGISKQFPGFPISTGRGMSKQLPGVPIAIGSGMSKQFPGSPIATGSGMSKQFPGSPIATGSGMSHPTGQQISSTLGFKQILYAHGSLVLLFLLFFFLGDLQSFSDSEQLLSLKMEFLSFDISSSKSNSLLLSEVHSYFLSSFGLQLLWAQLPSIQSLTSSSALS